MRERPRDFWTRQANFRGILKIEATIFLVSLFGAVASIPVHAYWAGVPYAGVALFSACSLWMHTGTGYGSAFDYGWEQGAAAAQRDADERYAAATRQCEILVPATDAPARYGYLYALKFSTGIVKVGQTRDLRRRLGEHRRDAEAFGAVIVDYWHSPPHQNYLENEVQLILRCDEVATWRSKREYFQGIDFAEVTDIAGTLTYDSTDAPADEGINT